MVVDVENISRVARKINLLDFPLPALTVLQVKTSQLAMIS